MKVRSALLAAAAAVALPLAAQAQPAAPPVTGLYIGAGLGGNFVNDTDVNSPNSRVDVDLDWGWVGVLSLGWGFGNGLRAELEGNYRWNEIDSASFNGVSSPNVGGRQQSLGLMANAFYDFNFVPYVVPYVGGGIGYLWSKWDGVRASGTVPGLGTGTVTVDDTDGRFAYQLIAGVGVPLNQVAWGLTLTAEYRFLGTVRGKYDTELRAGGANGPVVARGSAEPDNLNQSILLGVRYAFNQPRPVPPPAPAPAAAPAPEIARTYLVFFDWDRADLTDRARQIIGEAAQNSRRVQTTRIEVAGHADRSGSPQYNQRLSQRRADNVTAELVRQGVERNAIVVTAFGESRPLVPTADGVREPQNRRVEIVLR